MSHALDTEQPRSDSGPTVLVVDDELGLADLYAAWVGERYTAHVAYGGEEAVEMLDDGIDVVLLDRRMADLPGEAVVAEIDERELECCVAMVTVVDPDVGVPEWGVQDYLTKPVSQDELLEVVESLWDRQRCDEAVSELASLRSKRSALEERRSTVEIDTDEYQELLERIRAAQRKADDLGSRLGASDPKSLRREPGAKWRGR